MLTIPSERSTVFRLSWPIYALMLCALAAVLYAPVGEHLLDTHDADYFADSEESLRDPSYFFLPKSAYPGVPSLNYCCCSNMQPGGVIRVYFTGLALCCMQLLLGYWP